MALVRWPMALLKLLQRILLAPRLLRVWPGSSWAEPS